MSIRWIRILLLTLSMPVLFFLFGCGGGASNLNPADQGPAIPADGWIGCATLRDTSGAPSGVRLSWNVVDEATVVGYHVYKSASPIPLDERGNVALWLDIEGSPVYPQPTLPAVDITIDDLFPVSIGEVYYYRVTSIAADGSESQFSQEIAVTISDFSIDSLSATSVAGGSNFSILGENFGLYNMAVDEVTVRGVEWIIDVGFMLTDLQCPVVNWQPASIEVTLPLGATSGRVDVTVNGATQSSLESVMNSNPFITYCSHLTAAPGDFITLSGLHFGGPVDPNHRVVFGTLEMTNSEAYSVYAGDMIMFEAPNLPAGEYEVKVMVDGTSSNVAYIDLTEVSGPAWGHTLGSALTDAGSAVVAGESSDVYVAGYSSGFSAEPFDTLIVKYDAGTLVWAQSWNNTDNPVPASREESLNDICYNAGYVYATGSCLDNVGTPCVLLICYSVDGLFQYARYWGSGSTAMAYGTAITCDGTSLYIAGSYADTDPDLMMLQYDLVGNLILAHTWSPSGNAESGYGVTVDSSGDLVFVGTADEAFSGSGADMFVLKTDTDFTKIWAEYWGTMSQEVVSTVTTDASDNILVGGSSYEWMTTDAEPVILELDSAGNIINEYRWPLSGTSSFVGLDFSSGGNLFGVISRWPGNDDIMIFDLDPTDYSCSAGWQFTDDVNSPIGTGSAINIYDDVLICGTAANVNGTWSELIQSGSAIVSGTIDIAETGTDPATATGSSNIATGTDTAVSGTEDTGGGNEDLLVYSISTG